MALDKQRILSELGSVMNQLQGADCGCMGKLFSGSGQGHPGQGHPGQGHPGQGYPGQGYSSQGYSSQGYPGQGSPGQAMGASLPTCGGCRRGCCQGHGFGGYGGAPCSSDAGAMGRPCMGHCNPPKLYADTYGYLNQNLMQPVVQEVYDDLRSISPANTIGNNPLAKQMGLGNGGNPMAEGGMENPTMQNMGGMPGGAGNPNAMQNMGGMAGADMANSNAKQSMGGMSAGNAMENPNNEQAGQMSGMGQMGAQIVNMMMSGGGGKPKNMPAQGGQLTEPMLIDAPHSPHGQVGVTPMNSHMAGQFGVGYMGMSSMGQGDPNATNMNQGNSNAQLLSPPTQYVTQDNMLTVGNAQANSTTGNMPQNMNSDSQQPGRGYMNPNPMPNASSNPYGQHRQGITKFNEMFPGVMQGDLGFDPMAIAIQMNPSNQKQAAMDTIQKLMSGKPGAFGNTGVTQSALESNQLQQTQNQVPVNQVGNQQIAPSQQNLTPTGQMANQQMLQGQQQIANPNIGAAAQPNQQVYTSLTGVPTMNQQQKQGQNAQQQLIDPNTGDVTNSPTSFERTTGNPNGQMQQSTLPTETAPSSAQEMYKEPIFPADTLRNPPTYHVKTQRNLQYNTLGQPVEMLPGSYYHTPEPGLPQTLSPQPILSKPVGNLGRLGVKSTISKTSLMGNRPVGQTPSRSQLQHVYHQYKGSQSYTQQNLRAPVQSATHSDGKLNTAPANAVPANHIPVEKVGGDTSANNQMNNQNILRVEEVKRQIGDVPATNNPHGDVPMEKPASLGRRSHRNGLQDMTYTAYPSHAAWSFHGEYYPPGAMASYYRNGNRKR